MNTDDNLVNLTLDQVRPIVEEYLALKSSIHCYECLTRCGMRDQPAAYAHGGGWLCHSHHKDLIHNNYVQTEDLL